MTEFEYAAIVYGILVALAIEAVAANLHRLFAARGRVKWHWMAPATAVNASLVTLIEFWTLWLRRNEAAGSYSFLLFLPFAISLGKAHVLTEPRLLAVIMFRKTSAAPFLQGEVVRHTAQVPADPDRAWRAHGAAPRTARSLGFPAPLK